MDEITSTHNVVRAKTRAISESVAQNEVTGSCQSSGRSALPMITGAIAADNPG